MKLAENKLLYPAFVIAATLGGYVAWAGMPFRQFLPLTLAGSDLALQMALAELPQGGQPILILDCLFALSYAYVLSLAAADLAPYSASPAAGRLLARAVWAGAAADIGENLMLLAVLGSPERISASLLRGAAVLKFAIFLAACGWVGGAAWRAHRRWWAAAALVAASLVLLGVFPELLAG